MIELCSIASGRSGNCICVGSDNTHILLDVGISGKRVEQGLEAFGLKACEMEGVFITHEHIDHTAGLGVLARRYGIPIYATKGTINGIKRTKSLGTIPEELFHEIPRTGEIKVGDLEVVSIPTSHDAAESCAYRVNHGGKSAAVMTDLGNYNQQIVDALQELDLLLLESNHDIRMLQVGPYPYPLKQRILGDYGHLSNERSGQLLGKLLHDKFSTVMLGHLSKENNLEELAYETVRQEIETGDNPYKADDFPVYIAKRDMVSQALRA